jgi:uncharacterized protein
MIFHLAFPVNNLSETRAFYTEILGCELGRSADKWIDINFFGHQLSAHLSEDCKNVIRNNVEDKSIPVPHFGCILSYEDFEVLEDRLRTKNINFEFEPFIRFPGEKGEQKTMFLQDPSGNFLEFKAFRENKQLFET